VLIDFKFENISCQNLRLSLSNSGFGNPSMIQRKLLFQTGGPDSRGFYERGKASTKLKVIEEAVDEEEEAEQKCHLISSISVDIFQQPKSLSNLFESRPKFYYHFICHPSNFRFFKCQPI